MTFNDRLVSAYRCFKHGILVFLIFYWNHLSDTVFERKAPDFVFTVVLLGKCERRRASDSKKYTHIHRQWQTKSYCLPGFFATERVYLAFYIRNSCNICFYNGCYSIDHDNVRRIKRSSVRPRFRGTTNENNIRIARRDNVVVGFCVWSCGVVDMRASVKRHKSLTNVLFIWKIWSLFIWIGFRRIVSSVLHFLYQHIHWTYVLYFLSLF